MRLMLPLRTSNTFNKFSQFHNTFRPLEITQWGQEKKKFIEKTDIEQLEIYKDAFLLFTRFFSLNIILSADLRNS